MDKNVNANLVNKCRITQVCRLKTKQINQLNELVKFF